MGGDIAIYLVLGAMILALYFVSGASKRLVGRADSAGHAALSGMPGFKPEAGHVSGDVGLAINRETRQMAIWRRESGPQMVGLSEVAGFQIGTDPLAANKWKLTLISSKSGEAFFQIDLPSADEAMQWDAALEQLLGATHRR